MSNIGHNGGPVLSDDATGNWIAVSRDMRNHAVVGFGSEGRYSRSEAWLDLIMVAQYRPRRVDNKGKSITLEPGQLLGARQWLAKRWSWSEQEVRTFLNRLEAEGMIKRTQPEVVKTTQKAETKLNSSAYATISEANQRATSNRRNSMNVLTIENYVKYQRIESAIMAFIEKQKEAEATSVSTSNQPASNQRATSEQPESNKETRETSKTQDPPNPQTIESLSLSQDVGGGEKCGHGVTVDGEMIRHRDFSISLKAIEMQCIGDNFSMDKIRSVALGKALEWAVALEDGKPKKSVVPDHPASAIRGALKYIKNNDAVTDVRKTKAAAEFGSRAPVGNRVRIGA